MVLQNSRLSPTLPLRLPFILRSQIKEKVIAGIVNHVSSLKDNTFVWIAAADEGLKH